MDEIEEHVVTALSKTKLGYKVLHRMSLFDELGEEIKVEALNKEAQPLLDGEIVQTSCLLEVGEKTAATYRIEILDPNSMSVETFEGNILRVQNMRSLANYAVMKADNEMKDASAAFIEDV